MSFRTKTVNCSVTPAVVKSTCSKNIETSLDPYSVIEDITKNLAVGLEEAVVKASAAGGLLEGWPIFSLELTGLLDLACLQLLLLKSGFWANTTENPVDRVCKCESNCCGAGSVNKEFNFVINYSKLLEALTNTPELSMLGPALSVVLGGALGFNGCCIENHQLLNAQFSLYQTFALIYYLAFLIIVSVFVMDFNCNENTGLWAFLGCVNKTECCPQSCSQDGMGALLEALHLALLSTLESTNPPKPPNPALIMPKSREVPPETEQAAIAMVLGANGILDFLNQRLSSCGIMNLLGVAVSTQVSILELMEVAYLEIVNNLPPPLPSASTSATSSPSVNANVL